MAADSGGFFVDGAVPESLVAELIGSHAMNASGVASDGAQSIFLGRVRADIYDGQRVVSLEYESYREMAQPAARRIVEEVAREFGLSVLEVRHSLGRVEAGRLCFAVVAAAPRRGSAADGCRAAVERIKREVPIFAKEMLQDGTHRWKRNT